MTERDSVRRISRSAGQMVKRWNNPDALVNAEVLRLGCATAAPRPRVPSSGLAAVSATRRAAASAGENGFGRAVSRILSSALRPERIICLSSQYPEPIPLARELERAAPWSPIWLCTRWGLPCPRACAWGGALLPHLFTLTAPVARHGGLSFCGTVRRCASRQHRPRVSPAEPELRGIAPYGVRTFLPQREPGAILHPSEAGATIGRTEGKSKATNRRLNPPPPTPCRGCNRESGRSADKRRSWTATGRPPWSGSAAACDSPRRRCAGCPRSHCRPCS